MPFCSGGDLQKLMVKKRNLWQKHGINEKEAIGYMVQMADGLRYIHTHQIVHRDLKPNNVFVYDDEKHGLILKLADFGMAKNTNVSLAKTVCGTPMYMVCVAIFCDIFASHRNNIKMPVMVLLLIFGVWDVYFCGC